VQEVHGKRNFRVGLGEPDEAGGAPGEASRAVLNESVEAQVIGAKGLGTTGCAWAARVTIRTRREWSVVELG